MTVGQAHVCARCAARGRTCCEPDDGVSLAPLGPADVLRIIGATGLAVEAFAREVALDRIDRAALRLEDPAAAAMLKGAPGRTLLAVDGRCVFHDRASGCRLAYDVRPLHCRRFPFVRQGRFHVVRPGGACLAVEESKDLPDLVERLGTSLPELDRIDAEMRRGG